MELFVYGELQRPPVLLELLGRVPPMSVAVLEGYRRRRNPRTGHLEVVPCPGAAVVGLLLEGIAPADCRRLDEYEGVARGLYRRVPVELEVAGGRPRRRRAWAYVAAAPVRPGGR